MILFYMVVFAYGIVVGSFLNVCILRIPANESIAREPSHCPKCGHKLSWFELIPLFSYLFLRGRCRHCHERISIQYPIVEALNGILWCLTFWIVGWRWESVFICLVVSALIVISVVDWRSFEIPFGSVAFIFVLAMIHLAFVIWYPKAAAGSGGVEAWQLYRLLGLDGDGAVLRAGLFENVSRYASGAGGYAASAGAVAGSIETGMFSGTLKAFAAQTGMASAGVGTVSSGIRTLTAAQAGVSAGTTGMAAAGSGLPGHIGNMLTALGSEVRIITDGVGLVAAEAGSDTAGIAHVVWHEYIAGMFTVSVPLLIIYLITGGKGFGGGDIKLMAAAGLLMGWKLALLALMAGCLYGSVIHIIRMKVAKAGRVLAMGPYLSAGILTAMWVGNVVIKWYVGLMW